MNLHVRLYPPLNNTAGRDRFQLSLEGRVTIQSVIEELVRRFGSRLRRHLYDDKDRLIPAWCVFINDRPIYLNRPEVLETPLNDGDELALLLALAGG